MKKILSILLSVVMVLTVCPLALSVNAVECGDFDYELVEGNAVVTGYRGNSPDLTVPGLLDGYTVTAIDAGAFGSCTFLESIAIPDSVTSIGEDAFYYCDALKSVSIPYGVTEIANGTFYHCSSLKEVTIPNSVTAIRDDAFYACGFEEITIPDSVEVIESAFPECRSLKSIVIPNSVTELGSAFAGCISLASVVIPDSITSISGSTFNHCYALKEVTIPESITEIGDMAFANCGLESISIPKGVTDLGDQVFMACVSLESVDIPKSVENIGGSTFVNCLSLESINVDEENENYKSVDNVLFDKDVTQIMCFPPAKEDESYDIPSTVTSIADSAFAYCDSLVNVTIPDGVTEIGGHAFTNCSSLEDVTLPDGVTSIGDYAFNQCNSMGEINIPDGVESIGDSAFFLCTSLDELRIPPSVTSIGDDAFGFCPDLILIVDEGSYAEGYCKENSVDYKHPGDVDPIYFPDVPENAWFYDAVQYCAQKGFITGYKDGRFGPSDTLKRQDFVVILARIANADLSAYENAESAMPDVIKGSYYAASVNWAVDNHIINGYDSGKFGVGDNITREQVCVILYRYMGSSAVENAEETLAPFADAAKISTFAKDAVVWAIQNGVISGKNPTTLAPVSTASRAEIATIIMRMDKAGMFETV